MRKLTTPVFCAILLLTSVLTQSSSAQVSVNGGQLAVEAVLGTGSNTSYFVIDFASTPASANTPRDSYAFGYQFDASTTAADGLLDIASQSELIFDSLDFGGSLGLAINAFTFGADTDQPDFNVDGRFWTTFTGAINSGVVDFSVSNLGISSISLEDGDFIGFRANIFEDNPPTPNLPLNAIPEPGSLTLIFAAGSLLTLRRRRVS